MAAPCPRVLPGQVVPRQPDASPGRAHADAGAAGWSVPGAEAQRAQLLRHLLPVSVATTRSAGLGQAEGWLLGTRAGCQGFAEGHSDAVVKGEPSLR